MTNFTMSASDVPVSEQARVAIATSALNTVSRVGRRFGDPFAAFDAPGGPIDRDALHNALLKAGPLVKSRFGVYLTPNHAGCHAVFTSPHASSKVTRPESAIGRNVTYRSRLTT
jgi:hypothetical protein